MNWLLLVVGTVLNGFLYRLGGSSQGNKLYRRIGCSLVTTLMIGFLWQWHWVLIIHMGLLYTALTSYWDFIGDTDHHGLHGLGCGLALIPLCFVGYPWGMMVLRTVILAVAMGVWSVSVSHDVREEWGRGVILGLTNIIFLW